MATIEIQQYDARMAHEWDEFVQHSKNGTFLLQRRYMDYHSDRFADNSLLARNAESGKLLALLPACRIDNELHSHAGLTYGGWILPLKSVDVTVVLSIFDSLLNYMRANSLTRLVYKPVPHIYHSYAAEEDLYALWRNDAKLVACNVSTAIPLHNALPMDRGNKSNLNTALSAGVEVGWSNDWEHYWQVLSELLHERYDTHPVHSLAEIKMLAGRFPDNIKLAVASIGGEIVAGVVVFEQPGGVMHCQYIAASPVGKQTKALTAVFQFLIADAKARGFRWFDFGTSNEQQGHFLNEGLVQQKSRLGGRAIVYNTYEITTESEK